MEYCRSIVPAAAAASQPLSLRRNPTPPPTLFLPHFPNKPPFPSLSFHYPQCHHLGRIACKNHTGTNTGTDTGMPFIAHFLMSEFDFSLHRATKVAGNQHLGSIKPDRVNSVIAFLKEIGLNDAKIRNLVSLDPYILGSNAEKSLRPRARELIAAGFAGEILAQLIESNPVCLKLDGTLNRLRFWVSFIGDKDEVLLKVLRRNRFLISLDIHDYVAPRVDLLKEFGLTDADIVNLLTKGQGCFVRTLQSLREILERTERLGFDRGSPMFVSALRVVSTYSEETLSRKKELFVTMYGWSDEEFSTAVKKFPVIFSLSEKNVRSKMDFLVTDVGLTPRSVAFIPTLLSYSLSRLASRHNVLRALEAKGIKKNCNLLNACVLSDKRFLDLYVTPFEKDLRGLNEAYVDTYLEKVLV